MGFSLVWYALLGPSGPGEAFSLSSRSLDLESAAGIQPLYELLRIALRGLPGHELQAIWWSSMLFVAAGAALVLWTTHRASGSLRSATIAGLILAFGIDGIWAASTFGPASLALFLTSAALAASTIERDTLRHALIAVLGGLSLSITPLLFIICAAFWFGELRDYSSAPARKGTSQSLDLPVSWLAVPLVVLAAALVVNPWLWSGLEATKTWLLSLLKYSPDRFVYLGEVYTSARPPLWLGLTVLFFETPIVLLVLCGLPIFWKRLSARVGRNLLAIVIVCLAMPWVIRSSSWHGVPINAIWAPALAILAGSSLEGLYERIDFESKRTRAAAIVATGLVVCGLAFESLAWREAPSAYRNLLLNSEASMKLGEPVLRSPAMSPAAFHAVPAASAGKLEPLVRAYRAADFFSTPEIVPDGNLATPPNRFGRGMTGSDPFAKPVRTFDVQGIPILWREE